MSSEPEAPTRVEDVQDIMKRNSSPSIYDGKNDVTCGKSGGKQQSRLRALSGNAAKPCAKEEKRERQRYAFMRVSHFR